jgi:S1-C subfamily serine protease
LRFGIVMSIISALLSLLLVGDPPSAHVRATVWIRAGDRAVGTGWLVDVERRWVVTARHVVADRDSVEVYFPDVVLNRLVADRGHYVGDRADLRKRGLVAEARVAAKADKADLALLILDHVPPGTPALRFSDRGAVAGEECWAVGHRHDAERMWNLTAGHVRQTGRLADGYFWAGQRLGRDVPVVLLQAPIEAGESGAAVVNADREVVAVVSAVVAQTPGLAIGIDASQVRALLCAHRSDSTGASPAPRTAASDMARATVWVRPRATDARAAGAVIDLNRKLVLTSATAVGRDRIVEVVAPQWETGRVVAEADSYRDLLGLRLTGRCVSAIVIARDELRDLALVELDDMPNGLEAVSVAQADPKMGDRIGSMSHPTGIDLLWLYAAGAVRSVGNAELVRTGPPDNPPKVRASLLQLPHQGGSSGGPVVNEAGELIGVLAAREAARQDLAYAATPAEIRSFLRHSRPSWEPQSAGEWLMRGKSAAELGRHATAVEAMRIAARSAQEDARIQARLASSLIRLGRPDEAEPAADLAARVARDADTLAQVAAVLADLGKRERAAEIVDRALKADPRCAAAHAVRARLRSGADAEADIAEALFLDPSCAAAYRVRAGLRDWSTTAGQRDAIVDWGRVLELAPTDTATLRERATLYEAVREPKKAIPDWTRLTELEPLARDNYLGLARGRFAAGDRTGAVDALVDAARVEKAGAVEVFRLVCKLGRALEADNPADRGRVAEWYSMAVTRLAPWLPSGEEVPE